jgi:alpha-amylase
MSQPPNSRPPLLALKSKCNALVLLFSIAGLVGDLCAQAPATQSGPAQARRNWSDQVLYFVLIDRFADGDPTNNFQVDLQAKGAFHGGDLSGLREQLDQIAELGVTALWINPVVKNIDGFVSGAGFPDWAYHGYWADDFTAVDHRFGSETELKALVDTCHQRGIRVLLDVVYNHAGYGSRYLTDPKTKGWIRSEETGTCGQDDLTSCVAGLPDFKTDLPEVTDYLMSAHLDRARRCGLDGFRLDTVKHVEHAFWHQHRQRSRQELGPNFFLLGEVWGGDSQVLDPWFEGDELDAGFDFSFQGNVVSFLLGRGRAVAFDHYLRSRERIRPGHLLAHFLSSHDVPGALWLLGGDHQLFRLAAILQLTTAGIPIIYYGEEVGRAGGEWPENRSDMPWGERDIQPGAHKPRDEQLRADYRRLIGIRRAHSALTHGTHYSLVSEGDVLIFGRYDPASGDAVVVALNRGGQPASARFSVPQEWGWSAARDLWDDAPVSIDSGTMELSIEARNARILGTR